MPLFTHRERVAVMIVMGLIVCGWIVRLVSVDDDHSSEVTLIRGAVDPPAEMMINKNSITEPTPSDPLDINTCSKSELEVLPMIGATRASAIVAYREKHGPFDSPEDIMRVSGIGDGIYSRIVDLITTSSGDSTNSQ